MNEKNYLTERTWEPLDFSAVRTVSLKSRSSKVDISKFAKPWSRISGIKEFIDTLPDILAGRALRSTVEALVTAYRGGHTVILGMGAHPIKVGLGPIIVQALEEKILTGVATNGAAIIHDVEIALSGHTSEDVESHLNDGTFGMVEDTARCIHEAVREAGSSTMKRGLGWVIGRKIWEDGLPYREHSIYATSYHLNIPTTVHVAIGTDIIHMHPHMDGAAIGDLSYTDFRIFCSLVSSLENGVYINLGSAVILPEVFLKAVAVCRNLGYSLVDMTAIVMDFKMQYRPLKNVVERPTTPGGKGYYIIGHHEILIPLLFASVMEHLKGEGKHDS